MKTYNYRFVIKKDTGIAWSNSSYIPLEGEPCYDTTNKIFKIGNGINTFPNLDAIAGGLNQAILDNYILSSTKGEPLGVSTLNIEGHVPLDQLDIIDDNISDIRYTYSSAKINSLLVNGVSFKGHWDASTNTPTIAYDIGNNGDFYIVSSPGSLITNNDPIIFKEGDVIIYSEDTGLWERSINTNLVDSVNGQTGNVNLTINDLSDVVAEGLINPGSILEFNGTNWLSVPKLTYNLDSITDVDTSSIAPQVGESLVYDGGNWVPSEANGVIKAFDQGNGTGWSLKYRIDNPTKYGNIGEGALDFSISNLVGDFGATNLHSFAEGYNTTSSGENSHAEGADAVASGNVSHAEGYKTVASGDVSHAEGFGTIAKNPNSHAAGRYNIGTSTDTIHETGIGADVNNRKNAFEIYTDGRLVAPELTESLINSSKSLVTREYVENRDILIEVTEGDNGSNYNGYPGYGGGITTTGWRLKDASEWKGVMGDESVDFSFADDLYSASTSTLGPTGGNSFSEGVNTTASGDISHSEGVNTLASGNQSHAEGFHTTASGENSHAEGSYATASGENSHAEGRSTTALNLNSHAEGISTTASEYASHAEGSHTTASGENSHAEGSYAVASGYSSHAEGYYTTASGENSHAEGYSTTASEYASHAEGYYATASGENSHAEGYKATASGENSHAEGYKATASGENSHAEGFYTTALNPNSHAAGRYNIGTSTDTIHETGIGADNDNRKNAFEIYTDGRLVAPELTEALINTDKSLITKEYLEANAGGGELEKITSYSNGIGRRIKDRPADQYFPIGEEAVDLSYSIASGTGEDSVGAQGYASHAEGLMTRAMGAYSHAEGFYTTTTSGSYGYIVSIPTIGENKVKMDFAHNYQVGSYIILIDPSNLTNSYMLTSYKVLSWDDSEKILELEGLSADTNMVGYKITDNNSGYGSNHAEGNNTRAIGYYGSHAEGSYTAAVGYASHSEGYLAVAGDPLNKNEWQFAAHAEGWGTYAAGGSSHAEGFYTTSLGEYTHAQGEQTLATNIASFSGGRFSVSGTTDTLGKIINFDSANKKITLKSGDVSRLGISTNQQVWHLSDLTRHAYGNSHITIVSIDGDILTLSEEMSSSTGNLGIYDEDYLVVRTKNNYTGLSNDVGPSFTFGLSSITYVNGGVTLGKGLVNFNENSFVAGHYNNISQDTSFEVGIGIDDDNRKNAFEIYTDGRLVAPELTTDLITDPKSLVTKEYVDNSAYIDTVETDFEAADGQTLFVLTGIVRSYARVYINGIRLKSDKFIISDNAVDTTITLNNASAQNDWVLIET